MSSRGMENNLWTSPHLYLKYMFNIVYVYLYNIIMWETGDLCVKKYVL